MLLTKPITLELEKNALQPRPQHSHKGMYGHVLIVGGAPGFRGAAFIAGEAALRVGAGLVSLATLGKIEIFHPERPELMAHGIASENDLGELLPKTNVLALGPGLGTSLLAKNLWQKALYFNGPIVLDADGLNLLAAKPCQKSNWILTPHVGEAARLLKTTSDEIQNDRPAAIAALQKKFGGVVVLKGHGTLVAGPECKTFGICNEGNPGMASGGMGDALTGVIAGLLAQGLDLLSAAKLGVCLHARAGDLAAKAGGERGLLASDLMGVLRQLVN